MLKRLDLPDGQWADLLVKPHHSEYLAIIEAFEDAARGRETMARWAFIVGREYTKAWHIRGEDGALIEYPDWDALDPDYTDALCTEAQNRWHEWSEKRRPLVMRRPRSNGSSDPETTEAPSAPTSAEAPSPSPI